jgi:dephospho-CoA kinase
VEWVFGYGSLASVEHSGHSRRAVLHGGRLSWGVAMDNAVAIPGYKVWEDAATGERPDVRVAFLALELVADRSGGDVPGVLVPARDLAALDARERNYERVDVTERVEPSPSPAGRVWAYVGHAAARERVHRGPVVVARSYLALVPASAPSPSMPVADLVRVDL